MTDGVRTPAVVFTAARQVETMEVPLDPPAGGEVQLRTDYSMVSGGTEGWILQDRFQGPVQYPVVPGYQRVGTVVAIGEDVDSWQPGDRAVATVAPRSSAPAAMFGAHSAIANTPVGEVYAVPDGINDVDAACAVAATVGYTAASRLTMAPGEWVLVYGDGLIGQLAAQAARHLGAQVILVGHRPDRLALAADHSADHALDERDPRLHALVRDLVRSETVCALIDTVQTEALQNRYMDLLEPVRGQIVYSGWSPATPWADMYLLQQREVTTHNVAGWSRPRLEESLELLASGALKALPLVTHHVEPGAVPDMYRMTLERSDPHLGIVVDWRATAVASA
jgi:2-desacetyl-2-hydroxyethyl bacteriochlorophyllide A dehydrogenase